MIEAYRWTIFTQTKDTNFEKELKTLCGKYNAIDLKPENVAIDIDKLLKLHSLEDK